LCRALGRGGGRRERGSACGLSRRLAAVLASGLWSDFGRMFRTLSWWRTAEPALALCLSARSRRETALSRRRGCLAPGESRGLTRYSVAVAPPSRSARAAVLASSVQRSKPTPYPSKARSALIRRAVVVVLILVALTLITISFRSPTSGALHGL